MTYLYGQPVQEQILTGLHNEWATSAITPHLRVLMVGDNRASESYIAHKRHVIQNLGGELSVTRFSEQDDEKEVIETIKAYNTDTNIDGILLQLPVPSAYNTSTLLNTISTDKDVDGLAAGNLGRLFYAENHSQFKPATVQAVLELLAYYQVSLKSRHVVLVGAGLLVNQPLYHILIARGASVTTVHQDTPDIKPFTQHGDLLITATGQAGLITADHIKEGATVIDVGFSHDSHGRVVGDVDAEEVRSKADALSPVPGGVGPVTVACLAHNVFRAAKLNSLPNS